MSRVGSQLELRVDGLAAGGDGVGRVDGKVCFVPLGAPGDRLRVRVLSETRRFVRAAIDEIIEPGPGRREPRCPLFAECGGCDWQHVDEGVQLAARAAFVERAVGVPVPAPSPSPRSFGYRRVARLHGAPGGSARAVLGFARRDGRGLTDLGGCAVLTPGIERAIQPVRERLVARLDGAAEIVLGEGTEGVVVVVRSVRPLPEELYRGAEQLVPEPLVGVVIELDGIRSTVVGRGELTVAGGDGRPSRVPAGSFGQANAEVNLALARTVGEWIAAGSYASAIELFAGAGNLTTVLATKVDRATAIEMDELACRAARRNLADREIDGVTVGVGEALEQYRRLGRRQELVLLDPPRTGHRELARELSRGDHRAVIYVSCDPATLGRDLAELADGGYEPVRVRAFDMFPQTAHVETAVLLER